MTSPNDHQQLARRVEELGLQLEGLEERLAAVEQGRLSQPVRAPKSSERGAGVEMLEEHAGRVAEAGRMSTLLGRAAVACFLLVVALLLRTLADSQWVTMANGIWLGLGYAVLLGTAGWVLLRRDAGQAPTYCITGAALLGSVLLEGVFRHAVVPLPVAYALLISVAAGTGWALRGRAAPWILWAVGVIVIGTGAALLLARPPLPWPVVLGLTCCAMAGRDGETRGRVLFRAGAWLILMALWGGWGLALSGAQSSGAGIPAHLAPDRFSWMLATTLAYLVASSVLEAVRQPKRWLDAFDACLLPLSLCWVHLVGVWVLSELGGRLGWLGWFELGVAGLALASSWRLIRASGAQGEGATGAGLLSMGAAVLLFLGLPLALGGVAAVALWAAAAYGLARLAQRWGSGGARLASYLLPFAGSLYGWFASGLEYGGAAGAIAGGVLATAAGAAALQYAGQRRWRVPEFSRFFSTVDQRDDTGTLPLLAAVAYAVGALGRGVHPLLAVALADPAAALPSVQSVSLGLAALGLIVFGQRRGDARIRGVGVLVLGVAAVRVLGFELLTSQGLPLVFSVLGLGVAAGGAAVTLRRPAAAAGPGELESAPGDE